MNENISEPEVLVRIEGAVGRLTLNRPRALHALTTEMCRTMAEALLSWREALGLQMVMIDHAGERGFCAGGDVRRVAQDGHEAREFFRAEYQLNELLFRYPKHVVALLDGVTMGGGVGISRPARFRVATERTVFAMPEASIGLFPDVGGGWYLSRMPGQIGLWLALTGARLTASDCKLVGAATHYVESASLPELKTAIFAEPAAVEHLLTEFAADPGPPSLAVHQDEIDRIFSLGSVEAIFEALAEAGTDWAREQLAVLRAKSPLTLKVAFRQLRLGAKARSFSENMVMEYRIATRLAQRHDFREGVRALLLDKDNAPQWDPPTLDGVSDALLDEIFAPLPSTEEWAPLP
ncbi:MAG: enoyl-CoA hydratase/isomerase family protein [Candidatus Promineifilaceae bacterium]|jgi:enoyl-CoA hydratase